MQYRDLHPEDERIVGIIRRMCPIDVLNEDPTD